VIARRAYLKEKSLMAKKQQDEKSTLIAIGLYQDIVDEEEFARQAIIRGARRLGKVNDEVILSATNHIKAENE